jgi:DNA replicative helicase MCM subunit Mcm2 (Cdc46/Mcm family)
MAEPFAVWSLYCPEPYTPDDQRVPVVRALVAFFAEHEEFVSLVQPPHARALAAPSDGRGPVGARARACAQEEARTHARLTMNYMQLCALIPVAEFPSVLRDEPTMVLGCLALAAHTALLARPGEGAAELPKLVVRLTNYRPMTSLRNIKSNMVDKFLCVRGNVVRVSSIKPLVTKMSFRCPRCSAVQTRAFPDGKYNPPTACEVRRV